SSVARLIRKHDCGATVAGGESEQLAAIISGWAEDRTKATRLGLAARRLFEEQFDRDLAGGGYLLSLTKCFDGAFNNNAEALNGSPIEAVPMKTVKTKGSIL